MVSQAGSRRYRGGLLDVFLVVDGSGVERRYLWCDRVRLHCGNFNTRGWS